MSAAAAVLSGQAFNPNRDYNHADDTEYKRLRDLANSEHRKRGDLIERSKAAYEQGDGAEAKELSNKAKEHAAKMDEYNQKAAEFVFRANNADSEADEIDLHGLYVKEAEEILTKRIQACLQRKDTHLDVIVGKGIHSDNHVAKLKPAVEQLCREHNFKYATEEDNAGVIVIDFTGSGGHVPLHDITNRPRPHKPYHQGQSRPHPQQQHYGQQSQYNQQQQQQQQSDTGNGLFDILCGIVKACLK